MNVPVGRFAPSPTGRMHLGNMLTALVSWLSVRRAGGKWILRVEDLDPQRSRREHALMIEDDLRWLGLDYDEGGTDDRGPHGPYSQSRRGAIYERMLTRLRATGMTYHCTCTRADLQATQAPHQSDGRIIYGGRCRPAHLPAFGLPEPERPAAVRLAVSDERIVLTDRVYGPQSVDLARECGDFVVRRADGAWAYQFAVVVDDALMGVTEVVRGVDLLPSAAQQTYLYRLLGYAPPEWAHVPLVCNAEGRRLSKRDSSLNMGALRERYTAEELLGLLGHLAGWLPAPRRATLAELLTLYTPPAPLPAIIYAGPNA